MNTKKSQVNIIIIAVLASWLFNIFPGRFLAAKLSTWPVLNRWKILSPQAPIVITNRETVRVEGGGDAQYAANSVKSKMSVVVEVKPTGAAVLGSAVNLTSDGSFVTGAGTFNSKTAAYFVVLSDGRQAPITQKSADEATSLVFFKADLDGVPAASLGNSKDLAVGDKIIFAHNSLQNFSNQIQAESVSFSQAQIQGRELESDYPRRGFGVFTSAPLLPGEAVANASGEIMGLWNGSEIISSDVLKHAMALYFQNPADIIRPGFGFFYQMVTPTESKLSGLSEGAEIKDVTAGSPARQAGLLSGDIIMEVDGQAVLQNSPLEEILQKYKPGDELKLNVGRGGEGVALILKAGELK